MFLYVFKSEPHDNLTILRAERHLKSIYLSICVIIEFCTLHSIDTMCYVDFFSCSKKEQKGNVT